LRRRGARLRRHRRCDASCLFAHRPLGSSENRRIRKRPLTARLEFAASRLCTAALGPRSVVASAHRVLSRFLIRECSTRNVGGQHLRRQRRDAGVTFPSTSAPSVRPEPEAVHDPVRSAVSASCLLRVRSAENRRGKRCKDAVFSAVSWADTAVASSGGVASAAEPHGDADHRSPNPVAGAPGSRPALAGPGWRPDALAGRPSGPLVRRDAATSSLACTPPGGVVIGCLRHPGSVSRG